MKKILVFLSVLLFPFLVNASHLDEDITILENGDVLVKEGISIDGSYNGFELKLKYKYNDDYEIYSADDLEIVKVCESDKTNSLTNIGSCFSQVDYATKGDSLLYTKEDYDTSTTLMLYNPSTRKKAFYVEYILKNVVVSHNDIAELRLNMLSTDLREDFDKISIKVNLDESVNDLRAWAHGPLWGNIKLSDNKDYALFTIEDYSKGTGVDIRMTFDKDLINTEKTTNVDMLDKIIEEETILADEANKERNSARALLENEKKIDKIITILSGAYIISLVVLTIVMYNKYDKEYFSAKRHIVCIFALCSGFRQGRRQLACLGCMPCAANYDRCRFRTSFHGTFKNEDKQDNFCGNMRLLRRYDKYRTCYGRHIFIFRKKLFGGKRTGV